LLNHLTLPVILDIQTNPPNDSKEQALVAQTLVCGWAIEHKLKFVLLQARLMLWAGRAFNWGSNTETHNEQSTRERANGRSSCTYFMIKRKWPIIVHILHEKTQNLFSCAYKSKCEGRCKSNPGTDWNDGES